MKYFSKISIVFIFCAISLSASAALIKGGGANSCAYFLQTYQKSSAMTNMWRQWISGFISGRNFENNLNKGNNIDEDAFVYEIKNYCEREPMKDVVDGVVWLYDKKLK